MPRVKKALPPPRMPDRPGRWKLLWRRQRKLLRPAALLSILLVASTGIAVTAHFVGNGPPLRERFGRATADIGMRVREIVVEGRQKTPEPMIWAALGVAKGDPILTYSVSDARHRIEELTWVQAVTVERRLPGTILVHITERRPFAVWQNQGRFVLIDRAGEVVTDSDVAKFGNELPLVVGPGAPQVAAALLDALDGQPTLKSHVTAAVRVGERRWNLHMTNGADVMLPENAEPIALAKLAEMQAQHALLDRPLLAVDMRLPDKLVIRAKGDSAPQDKPGAQQTRKPT